MNQQWMRLNCNVDVDQLRYQVARALENITVRFSNTLILS